MYTAVYAYVHVVPFILSACTYVRTYVHTYSVQLYDRVILSLTTENADPLMSWPMHVRSYVRTYIHRPIIITNMKMYLHEYLALELLRGRKTASLVVHWGSVQAVCRQQEHSHSHTLEDKVDTSHTHTDSQASPLKPAGCIAYHHLPSHRQDHPLLATKFTALTSPTPHMPPH